MKESLPMTQRRLRVVKWLGTTPAIGVCALCRREFKVPMSALRRTADAQAGLQEQFGSHECEPKDTSQAPARVPADILLRKSPTRKRTKRKTTTKKKMTMMMMTRETGTRSECARLF